MNNEMTTDNMSNEEVIEVLKGIVFNSFDRTTPKERQALVLAFKSLEERPKGDLISREYVESIVKAEVVDPQDGTEEWRSYVNDTCENILIKVHNATTVDLWQIRREATENALKKAEEMYKRPKGKWIGDCYNPECDQCHTKPLEVFCDSLGLDGESYVSIPMTFCPSCGAYMRRGEEENE